jgi:hypothetical protein
MLGLGRGLGSGIGVLFVGLSSCGGDAFSVAGEAGAVGATAVADASPVGDAQLSDASAAGSTWCSTQGTHTFCEDFSEGVPGQLMSADTAGAALERDTSTFPSGANPPLSMSATTPSLVNVGDSAAAIGIVGFPDNDGVHDVLQAEFDVSDSCFDHGDKDGVSILALSFTEDRYLLALVVESNGSELLEVTTGLDGGTTNAVLHPLSTGLPVDKWAAVNVDVNVGAASAAGSSVSGTATVKVNGLDVLAGQKLSLVPILGAHHPTLGLGASVKNDLGISDGCKVNVDEVLLDISVM